MTDAMENKHGQVCQSKHQDERPEVLVQNVDCVLKQLYCCQWHVPAFTGGFVQFSTIACYLFIPPLLSAAYILPFNAPLPRDSQEKPGLLCHFIADFCVIMACGIIGCLSRICFFW